MGDTPVNVDLDKASDRIKAATEAGDVYVDSLESIRDELDAGDGSGTQLGIMVAAQLKMTETETRYMIQSGIPKKVAAAVQAAAADVKKAAG